MTICINFPSDGRDIIHLVSSAMFIVSRCVIVANIWLGLKFACKELIQDGGGLLLVQVVVKILGLGVTQALHLLLHGEPPWGGG